jgi:hypothetical protein
MEGTIFMFTYKKGIWQSDILDTAGVSHGFSTRLGGKSALSHTSSMNTGFFRGDDDALVNENIAILCRLSGVSEMLYALRRFIPILFAT